jgi:hypothetical protein
MLSVRIDSRLATLEFIKSHPELHHYTTFEGLKGIFHSQSPWATHYTCLNDSTEVNLLRNPLAKTLAKHLREFVKRMQTKNSTARSMIEKEGGATALAIKEANIFTSILYKGTFGDHEKPAFMSHTLLRFAATQEISSTSVRTGF